MNCGIASVQLVLTVAISKPFPTNLLGSILWRPLKNYTYLPKDHNKGLLTFSMLITCGKHPAAKTLA